MEETHERHRGARRRGRAAGGSTVVPRRGGEEGIESRFFTLFRAPPRSGASCWRGPRRPVELFAEGDLRGRLDTTLSHGVTFRVAERQARAGDYRSANSNDGNLNYAPGPW